ncbi:MAG: DUF3536 domain-containing protein [Actinobacteria bacterium]|nr:DUF3536 domain-containing protein [Actinomycetota bacterium]
MPRYVCVHGHFYQPPRENPWLGSIEAQDSAYPYHDWNERITAECYATNAASRVLDDTGRIAHVINNYGRISFNVGPTLLAWMARAAPDIHQAIVDADHDSQKRFSGHGSALAQAYNHVIMPLANPRDRRTQVSWGVADFRHRFGRDPEGMWLPETAVDLDTLEALAEHGIRFTILAPHQVRRVRRIGERSFADVTADEVDTSVAYRVALPSGGRLAVFVYDGPISRAVAFEGLLSDGRLLAGRLVGAFRDHGGPQLVHIATDGESYGHHHRHGDMALAFALHQLQAAPDVELTNYGEFLERYPPRHELQIAGDTSWSCTHGVERWRSDCGCGGDGRPAWDQGWRAPLREALDWLRDEVNGHFERRAGLTLADPWAARDAYIRVVLDRSAAGVFLDDHAHRPLNDQERSQAWKLLELQRHAMLMYTSCGWFFDDLARIETIQVLQYAGRAIELAGEVLGIDLEGGFLDRLAHARSNDPAEGDGRDVYDRHVRPAMVGPAKVAVNHVVSSLFDGQPRIPNYTVQRERGRTLTAGAARLAVGRVTVRSVITAEAARLECGVLHLGDHNLDAGVRDAGQDAAYDAMAAELGDVFAVADFPAVIRRLGRHFGDQRHSLRTLFRDEQRRILRTILDSSVEDARASYRAIFRLRAPLMRYLTDLGGSLPRTFQRAADVVVNDDLQRALTAEDVDPQHVQALLDDARAWDIELDIVRLAHAVSAMLASLVEQLARRLAEPSLFRQFGEADGAALCRATTLAQMTRSLPFDVDLWRPQKVFYDMLQWVYPDLAGRAQAGDAAAAAWRARIEELGDALGVAVAAGPV